MLVSDNAARETMLHGPRQGSKHCTDFICLVGFIVAILALFVVAGIGAHEGNPSALEQFVTGSDFEGNRCGQDDAFKDFPFTYYTIKLGDQIPSNIDDLRAALRPVCTNACPLTNTGSLAVTSRPGDPCPTNAVGASLCTTYPAGTIVRVANYCLSSDAFDVGLNAGAWVQDIKQAGIIMAFSPLIALVLGFTFLSVIYHCGSLIIWVAMIGITVLPGVMGAIVWLNATSQENGSGSDADHDDIPGVDSLTPSTQKNIAIGLFVIAGILLIAMLCLCSTVKSVAQVVKSSSEFLTDVPSQMLQPILFGFCQLVILAILLLVGVQVASIGAVVPQDDACLSVIASGSPFCVQWDGSSQIYAVIFVMVMAFWLTSFLMAVSHYGTSFAVGEWYFATPDEHGRRLGHMLGCCDFKLTLRGIFSGLLNHPGSLATGSLVVTVCKVIRVAFGWVKVGDHADPNLCLKCIVCIAGCIVSCITRFVEAISEHAYVEIALTGHGFCESARRAMTMTIEHPGLFALVSNVAVAMEVLGMSIVAGGTLIIVSVALNWFPPEGLTSPTAPLVAAGIVGLVIGEITMHPLIVAARAGLHCFVLDEEQSKETGVHTARFAPPGVATFAQEGRNSHVVLS